MPGKPALDRFQFEQELASRARVRQSLARDQVVDLARSQPQVARNFGGDARRFFQITRKPRGKPAEDVLNIAKIIGLFL